MEYQYSPDSTYIVPLTERAEKDTKLEVSTFISGDKEAERIIELCTTDYYKYVEVVAQLDVEGSKMLINYLQDYLVLIGEGNKS